MSKASTAIKVRDSGSALVCGEAFQKLAERLLPAIWKAKEGFYDAFPDEMGDVVACATNLAFAAELYLKGLLIQLGLDVPMDHNLRNLYDLIAQPVRIVIESIYDTALPEDVRRLGGHVSFTYAKGPQEVQQWNDHRVSLTLPDVLARSKDLFVSWRYVFEFSPPEGSSHQFHQFEYGLLRCAAEVLRVELAVRLDESGKRPLLNPPAGES